MKNERLEIVVSNKEEAIIAEKAGANRIEISASPEALGLSVALEDITSIVVSVNIPVYVMVRPTAATYEYNEKQFNTILHTIELCKMAGVKGITIGFLKNGKFDREKLEKIISIKGDLEIIINRAIDSVINYEEEIDYLLSIKEVSGIQTSGGAEKIIDGRHRFKPMMIKYPNKFIVSSGININTMNQLLEEDIDRVIFQANSGVRKDGTFNTFLSFDKIKELQDRLSE